MEFHLSEEQKEFQRIAKEFVVNELKEKVREFDEKQEIPREILNSMFQLGFGGIVVEEQYGGLGCGMLDFAIVVEEISKICASTALSLIGSVLGSIPIILFGNAQQKGKYLPKIASGEMLAAFATSESGAGSDISSMSTSFIDDGDSYILNGTKCWITNASIADIYVVIAKDNENNTFSAFIVEKGTPGFEFGKKEDKMGMRNSCTGELIFNNCRISKENLLSKESDGMKIARITLNYSRPIIGAQALGISEGAFQDSLEYSRNRKQFGKPISSFQAVSHMLADMYVQIQSAKWQVYHACKCIDENGEDMEIAACMSKVVSSDVAMKVTVDAIQIFGGYGYVKDYPVEKRMRDAKVTQIYEGTNQILKNIMMKDLLKK